ncbi:cytochrome P450 [Hysterangium stoloniferum]|nr:cytochrome P450 [Hysterangium stoloniferum]
MAPLSMLATVVTVGLVFLVIKYILFPRSQRPLFPPGPKQHFLLGNLLDMPAQYEYVRFREWSKLYGSVMRLTVPGKSIIVLDKLEAAIDLLDKRSSIYSDRPSLTMLRDVVGWNWSIVMLNYGERFRKQRKVLHRGLNDETLVERYASIQENESYRILKNLHNDPNNFMVYAERLVLTPWGRSMISRVTYDYDPDTENDRYIWVAGQCENIIAQAGRPGAYLVDVFPILKYVPKWLPFTNFKRQAEVWSKLVEELLESPYEFENGTASASYVSKLLELGMEDEDAIKGKHMQGVRENVNLLQIIHTLQAFILAMTIYPEIQTRAQSELDSVVGSERLPRLSDRPNLPYIDCMVSELLRWSRAVPLGIAHELNRDDTYNGMFLPAGSVILANSWSMTRDEAMYTDPEVFKPERFLDKDCTDPREIVFGFGRRMCPGKQFADAAIFSGIASILSTFRISKSRDADGREITPPIEYTLGFVCNPKPFRCDIVLRSEDALLLIEDNSSGH